MPLSKRPYDIYTIILNNIKLPPKRLLNVVNVCWVEDESEDEENQNDDAEQDGAEKKSTDNKQNKDTIDNKTPDSLQFRSKTMIPVKVLTQEDCDSGKYSIFDVVMPLPGFSIEYPPNMRDYYEELLKKDELKLDMKHRYKCYSMCGGYRHVVARAGGVAWRCVRYSRPHADLLLSDADELEGRSDTGIEEDGKYKALLLTMTLPPSSYATMALRELLKVDTSGDNQALQNNYHQKTAKNDDQADQTEQKDDQGDQNEQKDTNEEECKDEEKGEKRKLNEDSEGLEVKRSRQSDDIE